MAAEEAVPAVCRSKRKMKTTDQVIDSIDEVLEPPVIGCPTIHYPKQKVKEDYYDEEVFDAARVAEETYLRLQANNGFRSEEIDWQLNNFHIDDEPDPISVEGLTEGATRHLLDYVRESIPITSSSRVNGMIFAPINYGEPRSFISAVEATGPVELLNSGTFTQIDFGLESPDYNEISSSTLLENSPNSLINRELTEPEKIFMNMLRKPDLPDLPSVLEWQSKLADCLLVNGPALDGCEIMAQEVDKSLFEVIITYIRTGVLNTDLEECSRLANEYEELSNEESDESRD